MKNIKFTVFILLLIFILFKILNWTGIFELVKINGSGNEPTLKSGELFFVSNIIKPKKLDFVLYDPNNTKASGNWVHRLCATENDTIEIKNGILFVNNENIDKKLTLKHSYKIRNTDFEKIKEKLRFNQNDVYKTKDLVFLSLTEEEAKKSKLIERFIEQGIDKDIHKLYSKEWNKDNFGPLIIPRGFVFFMGDNRDFCIDSRLLGLIPIKKLKGKILL